MKKHIQTLKRKLHQISWKKLSIIIIGVGFFSIGLLALWIATLKIPNLDAFEQRSVAQSTKIYDRTGEILLYDIHTDTRRTIVPFEAISQYIKNASISIEDAQFYEHNGIRPLSIARAVLANIFSLSKGQGGSTITQQVIKNSLLTSEKLISRKIKEWVLAVKLEKIMEKNSILNIYLNENPYGGSVYGVEEATQTFFGKKAADVTLAESAYIAALPQAPSYYSPYGSHKAELEKRKNLVLSEMLKNHYISDTEYAAALAEKVTFKPSSDRGIKAPHFVMYIKDILETKYGETVVREGGLKVITTLDYTLQKKAEELTKKYALDNEKNFNAENAAIVAIDPRSGGILAMVGSRDYFDKEIDGNFNVALADRQPGSSFKPFVYATAFNKGYTPDTVLFDLKTEFSSECNPDGTPSKPGAKCYMPQNYDLKYRGPISMRDALAQSLNVPAIKTLYLAGMRDSLRTAKDMGITSLTNTDQYGLTLVLGGGEVSLIDMTSAYGTFANNGLRNPYTGILKIENTSGETLEQYATSTIQVLPENTALTITDILSDNVARTPAFGDSSFLHIPGRQVAVKTGTTNDYKDAWIVGYTPSIAIGAWAGNNNNTSMEKKVAGMIIAPLWNAIMTSALQNLPTETYLKPEPINTLEMKPVLRGVWKGGQSFFTDSVSGKLATEYTPKETTVENVIQSVHSILYWVDKNDPRGPIPTNAAADSQFNLWEYPVRKWAQENGYADAVNVTIPTERDTVHTADSKPQVSIISPTENELYGEREKITLGLETQSKTSIRKIEIFINGELFESTTSNDSEISLNLRDVNSLQRENELKVRVIDSHYNVGESTMTLRIDKRD
ncbi:MAG: PBP1A family penicillin-binding protein [Candidatus Paceibacterota bacterium]